MRMRRIWEFLGIRMTRTLQHSKQRKGRPQPASFKAGQWTAFFVPTIHIGDYACFVYQSLLVMVIAFSMLSKYTYFTIMQRGKTYASHKKPPQKMLSATFCIKSTVRPSRARVSCSSAS